MKEKWSVVGVKLAPVLSRKYVFEADIGPFGNDWAKTSMLTHFLLHIFQENMTPRDISKFKQNVITQFWNCQLCHGDPLFFSLVQRTRTN